MTVLEHNMTKQITEDDLVQAIELVLATHAHEELYQYHKIMGTNYMNTLDDAARWFASRAFSYGWTAAKTVSGHPVCTRTALENINLHTV